jgi:hypothetical protein
VKKKIGIWLAACLLMLGAAMPVSVSAANDNVSEAESILDHNLGDGLFSNESTEEATETEETEATETEETEATETEETEATETEETETTETEEADTGLSPALIVLAIFCVVIVAFICFIVLLKKKSEEPETASTASPAARQGAGTGIPMKLEVLSGNCLTTATTLYLSGELYIGSGPGCDITFADPMVAPHHARIAKKDNAIVLEDMNSPTGTFLGGMRIQGANRLRSGDVISIGDSDFSLKF